MLTARAAERTTTPNVIIIYVDDMGYGDVGCFGSKVNRTPAVDRMATEGMRLTSFYVTSGVCTPSRSSLMTGCYPRRVNLHQDAKGRWVLFPAAHKGLNPKEITIAELLKARGYATCASASGTSATSRSSCPRGRASTATTASRTATTWTASRSPCR